MKSKNVPHVAERYVYSLLLDDNDDSDYGHQTDADFPEVVAWTKPLRPNRRLFKRRRNALEEAREVAEKCAEIVFT